MREIETTRFGQLKIEDEAVLVFPKGIPGFYDFTEWVVVGEDENPIKWMQSLKDGDVALPIAPPAVVAKDYNVRFAADDLLELETDRVEALSLFLVVSIPAGNPWEMTANLRAPIVVNHEKHLGKQLVALNEEYSMRTYVFNEEMRQALAAQSAAGEEVTARTEGS